MAKELKDLTKRSENYSQWYNDLVVKADLAEQSPVRGWQENGADGVLLAEIYHSRQQGACRGDEREGRRSPSVVCRGEQRLGASFDNQRT